MPRRGETEKEIYLVRHAQSQPSSQLDDPDWPLSDVGGRQAMQLVDVLNRLDIQAIYSSPYRRCVSTIQPFATARGLPVGVHAALRERRVAPYLIDNFREVWNRSWDDFDFALPACETSRAAHGRIANGLAAVCVAAPWSRAAVCSHGNIIALFLHSLDRAFGKEQADAIRNPDVLRVRYDGRRFELEKAFEVDGLNAFATPHDSTPFPR